MQSRWCHEKVSSVVSLNHNWIIFWIAARFACIPKKKSNRAVACTQPLLNFSIFVGTLSLQTTRYTHVRRRHTGPQKRRYQTKMCIHQASVTGLVDLTFRRSILKLQQAKKHKRSRCMSNLLSVTGLSRLHVFGRKTSCCEVAEASIQSCHGARTAHFCSPGCFLGHLRPISAQGCNLDWQRIAYNQPKKLFWTDQWGDLRVKPDEFTDWGKA